MNKYQKEVADFNAAVSIGTPVTYWPGARTGDGVKSRTRTDAQLLGNHTAVVWVDDHSACIALTHVEITQ